MRKILIAIAIAATLFASTNVSAQTLPEVRYQWTAPTTGSLAVTYAVEYSTDGSSWVQLAIVDTNQISIQDLFENHVTYQVRVAGIDAMGRQGSFSAPSDPYTVDLGVPGVPGKPVILQL